MRKLLIVKEGDRIAVFLSAKVLSTFFFFFLLRNDFSRHPAGTASLKELH